MNSMNSKLLYLPLRELQVYLNNLEMENEKLKSELTTFSRFNCILENIRRSSNKGFDAMQLIDRNKSCTCNEQLNGQLRRMAQEADIELRVWQEQYDKLVHKTKHDFMANFEEDNRSGSLSPRSSSSPLHDAQSVESEAETTSSISSIHSNHTSDTNSRNRSPVISSRNGSFSLDNDSGFRSNFSLNDNSNQTPPKVNDNQNGINDEAVIRYIARSPLTDDSVDATRTTPVVVYESKNDPKLACDWPNCNRVFSNDDILTHHRRNHIRKSIYSCEFCSTRLLSKEELDNHMKTHQVKTEHIDIDEEPELIVDEEQEEEVMRIDSQEPKLVSDNTSEAVNLSNKGLVSPAPVVPPTSPLNPLNEIQFTTNKTDRNPLTFQSALFERLSSPPQPKTSPPQPVITNPVRPMADNKVSPQMRSDEYKRTRYSGVGRYRCPWPDCGYTPHFLRDLRRHMFKHTGDKKHKCDYPGCDFVSVWKTSLLQHQRKKHYIVNGVNTVNTVNGITSNDSLFNKISV